LIFKLPFSLLPPFVTVRPFESVTVLPAGRGLVVVVVVAESEEGGADVLCAGENAANISSERRRGTKTLRIMALS
jgi:hypothetical protein